jgi:hypothetical protein
VTQTGQITGEIDFGVGTVTYDTNSLATAKEVHTWTNTQVTFNSGDFSSVALGESSQYDGALDLQSFDCDEPRLWSVGGFTFSLRVIADGLPWKRFGDCVFRARC